MLVFKLEGDGEYVTAALPGMLEMVVLVKDFLAERNNPDPMCRWRKAEEWEEMELHPYPGFNYKEGEPFYFNDVINASNSVLGADTIVSDQAKLELAPHIEHECVFLPVNLMGAPQKYWMMYVTHVLDCLDIRNSKFSHIRNPPKGIAHYSFNVEKLEDVYLFRLPGHFDYLEPRDFATQRFLDLTRKLGIRGFEFWELNKPGQDPIVTGD
jgi:hypothetical protein